MAESGFTALERQAGLLGQVLTERGLVCATAESCTGGMISMAITSVAGSSAWFDRGFVTYTNEAKMAMLGVDAALLAQHGAVSEAVAGAMARGAVAASQAALAVSVSGIAGPGGAVPGKPVGTVCFGVAGGDAPAAVHTQHFSGDRQSVRLQASVFALKCLIERAQTLRN
ncbi:nicotinamide-nucleotide amidohydrolase family protein [Granulosicoccaceae sp. 1_MG-2023]|nr:nicotinamide-nucleotide amidohydrolase family protein [Granulosicoccaceae sp. 1_MG-2023]